MKAELDNGSGIVRLIPENEADRKVLKAFREDPMLSNSGGFWGLKKNSNGEVEIYLSEQHENRSHKKFEIIGFTQTKKKFEITNLQ